MPTQHDPSSTGTTGATVAAPSVPATYRRDWAVFTDWCAAFDLEALPASTITVARFLAFEPHLAPATLRRRATAINHTHTAAGHSAPGTVTAIRTLLSRRDRHTARAAELIRHLPTSGWPAGLFGRRDSLILTLACVHKLPVDGVAALTCGDITYHPRTQTVHIGAGHDIIAPASTDPYGLFSVWRRWAVVRDRMIRYPAPRAWAMALHTAGPVTDTTPQRAVTDGPPDPYQPAAALFPALDRWGQTRYLDPHAPISARAVAHVLATRLTAPPSRTGAKIPPAWHRAGREFTPEVSRSISTAAPQLNPPAVDGAAARRRALTDLATLETVYSDIDDRTTDLLARTEQLLHEWKV